VDLHLPQEESASGLAEADPKNAEVKMPAGVTVNPSSAAGLAGCPLLKGKEGRPGVSGIDLEKGEACNCASASTIGSVELITPLVEHPLPGAIYLAQQGNAGAAHGSNPFGSLLALYIATDGPQSGVVVKLAGQVHLDPVTGQLSITFDENPQLPFEELKLDFFGGPRRRLPAPASAAAAPRRACWNRGRIRGRLGKRARRTPNPPRRLRSALVRVWVGALLVRGCSPRPSSRVR
jgi:hypothetical protein